MKKIQRLLTLILALVMSFALISCGSEKTSDLDNVTPDSGSTAYAQEVVIGLSREPITANPMQDSSSLDSQMLYYCTHETLVYYNPETKSFEPDIAESWTVSDDNLVYTFKIEQGIKFHNGEELTAEDVKFSYDYCADSPQKSRVKYISETRVIDPYTVEVELNTPFLDFLYSLAQPNASIICKKAVEAEGADGERYGTGPYVIDEWSLGEYIKLTRFEDYHGEAPKTEKLTFRLVAEDAARVIALETGDLDVCYSPAYLDHQFILDNDDLELVELPGLVTYYLGTNTQIEPFNNEKVRQALACAVNKEDCIAVAFGGAASVATSVMPTGVPMYLPVEGYSLDVEKAKSLLAEAGYPNGFSMEIGVSTDVHQNIAQVIQDNLKQIGITASITRYDTGTMSQMTQDGTYQTAIMNYSNGSGPSGSFNTPFGSTGSSNRCHVNDSYVDEMIELANVETDATKRAELYQELNQYITDKGYWIPVAVPNVYVGIDKNLEGVRYASNIRHDFSECYIIEK